MNFYEWMIGKYYGKDTPRGDLAGDMKHEEEGFPKDGDRQRILDYPRSEEHTSELQSP